MSQDIHADNKAAIGWLRSAQYDYQPEGVRAALLKVFKPDAVIHLATPFEDLDGPQGLYEQAYGPLHHALPDLERRDTIVMAGPSPQGHDWVGCCGFYTGTFVRPWLDIPPPGTRWRCAFMSSTAWRGNVWWKCRRCGTSPS